MDALKELRAAAPARSVFFSLEVVPFTEQPEKNLTLDLDQATVEEVLKSIVAEDPRYRYDVIDSHLIHVLPRCANRDPRDLLDVRLKNLQIQNQQYDMLLKYPQYFIPELEHEIEQRSGTLGYAGSMLGGVGLPRISVSMRTGTVRDFLNRVAQETEKFSDSSPTGWVYTFRTDDLSPLGGRPTWQTL